MGPPLAMALGPEGRLRPGFLDCKGEGGWWEGQEAAGVSHSPWSELHPEHH